MAEHASDVRDFVSHWRQDPTGRDDELVVAKVKYQSVARVARWREMKRASYEDEDAAHGIVEDVADGDCSPKGFSDDEHRNLRQRWRQEGSPLRNVRPHSASNSHGQSRERAAERAVGRQRPQSASASRRVNDFSSPHKKVQQQKEFAWMPAVIQRSKWTEMLHSSPGFQEHNLQRLEAETYALLKHVLERRPALRVQRDGKQPKGTKKDKIFERENERVASRPSSRGKPIAAGSGLQGVRRIKSKAEKTGIDKQAKRNPDANANSTRTQATRKEKKPANTKAVQGNPSRVLKLDIDETKLTDKELKKRHADAEARLRLMQEMGWLDELGSQKSLRDVTDSTRNKGTSINMKPDKDATKSKKKAKKKTKKEIVTTKSNTPAAEKEVLTGNAPGGQVRDAAFHFEDLVLELPHDVLCEGGPLSHDVASSWTHAKLLSREFSDHTSQQPEIVHGESGASYTKLADGEREVVRAQEHQADPVEVSTEVEAGEINRCDSDVGIWERGLAVGGGVVPHIVSVEPTPPSRDPTNDLTAAAHPLTDVDEPPEMTVSSTSNAGEPQPHSTNAARDAEARLIRSDTDRYDDDAFEDEKISSRRSSCGREIAEQQLLGFVASDDPVVATAEVENSAMHSEDVAAEDEEKYVTHSDDFDAVAPPPNNEDRHHNEALQDTALNVHSPTETRTSDSLKTTIVPSHWIEAARMVQSQYRVSLSRRVLLDQVKFLARKQLRKKRQTRGRVSKPGDDTLVAACEEIATAPEKFEDVRLHEADTSHQANEEEASMGNESIREEPHHAVVDSATEYVAPHEEAENLCTDESYAALATPSSSPTAEFSPEAMCVEIVDNLEEHEVGVAREGGIEETYGGPLEDHGAKAGYDASRKEIELVPASIEEEEEEGRGSLALAPCLSSESPATVEEGEIPLEDEVENTSVGSAPRIEDEQSVLSSSTHELSEKSDAEPDEKSDSSVISTIDPCKHPTECEPSIVLEFVDKVAADNHDEGESSPSPGDSTLHHLMHAVASGESFPSALCDADECVAVDSAQVTFSSSSVYVAEPKGAIDVVVVSTSSPIGSNAETTSYEDFGGGTPYEDDTCSERIRSKAAERIQKNWKRRLGRPSHRVDVREDPVERKVAAQGSKTESNDERASLLSPVDIDVPTNPLPRLDASTPSLSSGESHVSCSLSEGEVPESTGEESRRDNASNCVVSAEASNITAGEDQPVEILSPAAVADVDPHLDHESTAAVRIQCQYQRFVYRRALLDQLSFFVRQHRREIRRKTRQLSAGQADAAAASLVGRTTSESPDESSRGPDSHEKAGTDPLDSAEKPVTPAIESESTEAVPIVKAVEGRSETVKSCSEPAFESVLEVAAHTKHDNEADVSDEQSDSEALEAHECAQDVAVTSQGGSLQAASELPFEDGENPTISLPKEGKSIHSGSLWERYIDTNANKSFYFDTKRRVSQWDRPANDTVIDKTTEALDQPSVEEKSDSFSPQLEEMTTVEEHSSQVASPSRGRWERYMDSETNKSFYFNPTRKLSRWDRPEQEPVVDCVAGEGEQELVVSSDTAAATDLLGWWRQAKEQATLLESNGGWDRYLAQEGAVIFYHHAGRDEFHLESDSGAPEEFTVAKEALLSPVLEPTGEDKSSRWTLRRNRSLKGDKRGEWQAFVDTETHQTFYYNTLTGESTWDKPPAFQPSSADQASTTNYEWVMYVDPATSQPYYVNVATNVTSWDKPPDFYDATGTQDLHRLRGIGEHSDAIAASAPMTEDEDAAVEQDDYVISITDDRGADEWLAA